MEKKEYKAPQMTILDMKLQASLLSCSDCKDGPDEKEYDDELGFNVGSKNRNA